jgi:ATP-dependent RNA helicase DDX52/ROK1
MQYIAWPDHGVPHDCHNFLDFVGKVREALSKSGSGVSGPPIIHCSAGVGRTGVLIGLNTALCAMESGHAVDMLEIVRRMRDQRGVAVQTSEQFKFLCNAVLKVYDERLNSNNSSIPATRKSSMNISFNNGDDLELSSTDGSGEDDDDTSDKIMWSDVEPDNDDDNDEDADELSAATAEAIIAVPQVEELSKHKQHKKKKTAERLAQIHQEEVNHFRNQHHIHVYGTDIPDPIETFEHLETDHGVNPKILSNLRLMGFETPTVIEMQAIPVMLCRRELMACAPTGSGKTLAFVLPILHHLKAPCNGGFRALILAPTRELAEQTYREFNRIGEGLNLRVHIIHKVSNDIKKFGEKLFRKFDVLVTTPNRLVYLLQQEVPLSLSSVEWLVIDESDKLFEEGETGFRDQLAAIYKACDSKDVRRAMFSATFSYDVEEWCRLNLDNVVQVYVGARNSVAPTIQQELLYVGDESGKLLAIRDMIRKGIQPPVLIFVQSKDRAKDLFHELIYDGINVDVIHADRTQNQRDGVVRGFRSGTIWVLICTDVMCRGMDFKGVNLVINYDFPNSDYVYIHRIGRTGRAGRPGKAVTFFTDNDAVNLRCIANKMREAGCAVPDYMLKMKAPNRALKRKLKTSAPQRDSIRTDVAITKKKCKRPQSAVRPVGTSTKPNKAEVPASTKRHPAKKLKRDKDTDS